MEYVDAKREAQARADETGYDYGVEKLGSTCRCVALPQRDNRCGFELRCEVVSCTRLDRCKPGHGPVCKPAPSKRRVRIERDQIFLDGKSIGRVVKTAAGWESTTWPSTQYRIERPTYSAAILQCVHSYAGWVGWSHVICRGE